jgi:hypothetical protein
MAAIARLLSGNLQSDQNDVGTLKALGMFCGVGELTRWNTDARKVSAQRAGDQV